MIIVTLTGGLGNQLFQYAVAKKLALKIGTTLKLFKNNISNETGRSYKLSYYNINEVFATEQEVENLIGDYYSSSLRAKLYKKIDQYRPKHKRKYFQEEEYYVYEPELMKINSTVLLEGFWQNYRYFENLPLQIYNAVNLKDEYKDSFLNFLNDIEEDDCSVSIHIRRADYVSDPYNYSFFGVIPLEYYNRAIDYIKNKIKAANFYIFSDDLNWARENLKIDAPITFVEINGGTKDFAELEAMSKCRHNIIANSSFSWWGAFLNKNPDRIVIVPKQWVADNDMNKKIEIQMPSWIRM